MQKAIALAGSTHPGPALAVTVIAGALGIAAGVEPSRLALLVLVVLLNQASVGLSNDWIDAERDRAVGRTDKPVARGDIAVSVVRLAAFATLDLALLLTLPLGPGAFVVHAVFLGSAWSYNLGLKSTPASVLPYMVSFGLLPLLVTLSRGEPALAEPWACAAGALLGVGAHFANVLPDLDDDRRTGVRGLPHCLGRLPSVAITWIALLGASGVVAAGLGFAPIALGGLAASVAIAVVGLVQGLTRPPSRGQFRLIILAALVAVAQLVLAGQAILA